MDFRNQHLLLSEEAQGYSICLIGGGAINSFVAMLLTKMGYRVEIWDGDTIELHNIPNQVFPLDYVGKNKAEAVRDMCKMFSGKDITAVPVMWDKGQNLAQFDIVIAGVDSMKVRKEIFEAVGFPFTTLIEARMGGQNFRVYTVNSNADVEEYKKTLYSDEEAVQETCGQKSIIYTVAGVASEICNAVRRVSMGLDRNALTYKDFDVPKTIEYMEE